MAETLYQQLADEKIATIQAKVDEVHALSERIDALDNDIKDLHSLLKEKHQERGELSKKALALMSELV